ncbi:MAG: hypothetical protein WC048_04245 [Rhizobium sp.]
MTRVPKIRQTPRPVSSLKRARMIRQARSAARELGRNLADLIAPQILDPRADPAAVADVAKAVIQGVRIADEMPNVPADIVAKIEGDMHVAFWARMEKHTRNLR